MIDLDGFAPANVRVRIADGLAIIELDYGEQEPTELSMDAATAMRLAEALRDALLAAVGAALAPS
jgi:hypothetical protein